MTGMAYAMGAGGAGGGAASGGDMNFIIVMVAIFAIFYFLLIRPQQKKQKETKEMLSNIAHGDMIVTAGGLHGKITAITEQVVTLEVADKVKVKISRAHIAGITQKATP
ncbi:MAG: preprotein translocase subunit YajC [Deltaproteobacteria bacterium]|nr:preprotein translocase subunit YajC [Deltaproteobacteria bacterium]MBW2648709.1 preprotein translocase subunit YajC [Deltaproteobacteria bacterium]